MGVAAGAVWAALAALGAWTAGLMEIAGEGVLAAGMTACGHSRSSRSRVVITVARSGKPNMSSSRAIAEAPASDAPRGPLEAQTCSSVSFSEATVKK